MLCGWLMLQALQTKLKKSQSTGSPICQLCKVEAENREHFLLRCEPLGMIRQSHLERINTLMMSMGLDSTSGDTLLQCIMDPSHESLAGGLKGDPVVLSELERLSRDLVHSLYRKRLQLLNADANTVRGRGAGGTRALTVYTGKSSNQRERLHRVEKR
jgi:hypothetical protein